MEHRHLERKSLFLYLDVFNRETDSLLGHLGDISDGGLMLLTSMGLANGQLLKLRIKLPEGEGLPVHWDVDVETRWHKPDANPDLYCVGCHFKQLPKEDLALITQIAELLEF